MLLKRLYLWLVTVWKYLVNSYDDSILGKAISKTSGYFQSRIRTSVIFTYLRERFFDMSIAKHSIAAKLAFLPPSLLRNFYNSYGQKAANDLKESQTARFISNIPCISSRRLGLFLLFVGTGLLAGSPIVSGVTVTEIWISAGFIIVGAFLLPVKDSFFNIFMTSFAGKIISAFMLDVPIERKDAEDLLFKPAIIIPAAIILGLLAAVTNITYILLIPALLLVAALVLYKTAIGVFLLVLSAPILPTMAVAGLSCLCILSYVLHLAFDGEASYRMTPYSSVIAAFLILVGITSFTGIFPKSSIPAFLIYAIFTLTFPVITNTIKTEKQWKALISTFAISAFIVALYGVIQNFTTIGTNQSWVDGNMFENIKTRVFSTLTNPNILGQFLILSIPVTVACAIYSSNIKSRILYAVVILTMVLCLWFTWSRAAWVGVALAIVIMLSKKDHRFTGLCIFAFLLMLILLPQSIISRLTSIGNTNDTSTAYRVSVWIGSLGVARKFFLTGVGLGADAFGTAYTDFALGGADFAQHAHNFYLQLICDMGIGGLILFIFMILIAYKCISNLGKGNNLTNLVAYGCAGSLAGYMFQAFAETMWYNYRMLLVFWIFLAFIQIASGFTSSREGVECLD